MCKTSEICLVCLSVNVKLINLASGSLRRDIELLSGVNTSQEGLPQYLCFQCVASVRRFIKFRDKCHRAIDYLLQLLRDKNEISEAYIMSVDRNSLGVTPDISYLNHSSTNYEEIVHESDNEAESKQLNNFNPVILYTAGNTDNNQKETNINCEKEFNIKEEEIKNETHFSELEKDYEIFYETNCNPDHSFDNSKHEQNINTELISCGTPFSFELNIKEESNNEMEDVDNTENVSDDNNCRDAIGENENVYGINSNLKDDIKNTESRTETELFYLYPMSTEEAEEVAKISILRQNIGDYICAICKKSFDKAMELVAHFRLHEKYKDRPHRCDICHYYFESEHRLQSHNAEQHMYKYVCKLCPEVNYDRISAGRHIFTSHNIKIKLRKRKTRKQEKDMLMQNFFRQTLISPEEQYAMVRDRIKCTNYTSLPFKCEQCFKRFTKKETYDRHMLVHNPDVYGKYQCDMCKVCCKNLTTLNKHISSKHNTYKYCCVYCNFVTSSVKGARKHIHWHQNVTSSCSVCHRDFRTQQSSQRSQNIIETGHHQDQLNTRHTINVIVNNNKKERQKRHREQNRDKLKQREAERRERIQYSQSIAGPSTSSNTNRIELNNEEIITAQSSSGSEKIQPSSIQRNDQGNELNALKKKRERQQRYREQNRDKLKQREAERRRRLLYADVITELSTSPNIEFTE